MAAINCSLKYTFISIMLVVLPCITDWNQYYKNKKFCLLVCLVFFVLLENFLLIWRRHHLRWRTANSDIYSAPMAIDQWRFFSILHLLRHKASVYNGHQWGPVKLAPVADRLAVDMSLPVLQLRSVATGNTYPSSWKANALTDCATAADISILNYIYIIGFIVDFRPARYQRHRHCWFERSAKCRPPLGTYIWNLNKLGPFSWPAWMTLGLG